MTFGQSKAGYAANQNSLVSTLSTMVMTTQNSINAFNTTEFDTGLQVRFLILVIMMQYLLKMTTVCHAASVTLEHFHKLRYL